MEASSAGVLFRPQPTSLLSVQRHGGETDENEGQVDFALAVGLPHLGRRRQ